jgi:hypothetical protein
MGAQSGLAHSIKMATIAVKKSSEFSVRTFSQHGLLSCLISSNPLFLHTHVKSPVTSWVPVGAPN